MGTKKRAGLPPRVVHTELKHDDPIVVLAGTRDYETLKDMASYDSELSSGGDVSDALDCGIELAQKCEKLLRTTKQRFEIYSFTVDIPNTDLQNRLYFIVAGRRALKGLVESVEAVGAEAGVKDAEAGLW